MSDQINLTGIKAFGYHGVFKEERIHGQSFIADVELTLDLTKASQSDELDSTIDYSKVVDLVVDEIQGEAVNLIERLAGRIAEKIKSTYPVISKVVVTVHKPHAPVDAEVKDISVTISR
jgi:dihydroneopterin aldolase